MTVPRVLPLANAITSAEPGRVVPVYMRVGDGGSECHVADLHDAAPAAVAATLRAVADTIEEYGTRPPGDVLGEFTRRSLNLSGAGGDAPSTAAPGTGPDGGAPSTSGQ